MSVRVVYTAYARTRGIARAQRRAGLGVKEGGQGMDGICSIDFKSHFLSMIGSESYRCVA